MRMPDTEQESQLINQEAAKVRQERFWQLGHEQFTEELKALMERVPNNIFDVTDRLDAITIYILRFRG